MSRDQGVRASRSRTDRSITDHSDTEAPVSRRTALRSAVIGSVGTLAGCLSSSTPLTTVVTTESELADAIGTKSVVELDEDVTLTDTLTEDLGASDLDLNGHTIRKADGTDARLIDLTTDADITIRDGVIDCNRDGQNFPAVKTKEVNLFGGRACRVSGVTLLDNSNFGYNVVDFDEVLFTEPQVETHPEQITNSSDAAGLDGVHTFDCKRVSIMNPQIRSGDDCVAVGANDITVGNVDV